MKTTKIFYAIVFITLGICKIGATQTDSAFYFAEGTTWTMAHYSYESGCQKWKLSYSIHGDTLIGSNLYQKIVFTYDNRVDALEQGTVIPIRTENNEKLYARLGNTDILLCDFSVEVGDTIPMYEFDMTLAPYYFLYDYAIVYSIDTITLLDGRKARQVNYLGQFPDIEFVGGMYGLFTSFGLPALTTCGGADMCCSLNGEPIYETCPGTCARLNPAPPIRTNKYLQPGLSWQILYDNGAYFGSETLTVDTIVNGKEYLAFSRYFLMRDDSTGLYFHTNECDSDFLLFQYGANVGDSIMIYNSQYPTGMWAPQGCPGEDEWEGLYAVVTAVDTIHLLNGEPRRRIFYQSSMFMGGNWYIEGIGGFHGIKGDNFDTESYIPEMLCCYIGDTLLWARDDCEQWKGRYPNACLGYTGLNNIQVDDIQTDDSDNRKFLRDGQLLIETPIGTFNARGQQIE